MDKDATPIPDEEWERFLRDAETGSPGAPEEPSARARMVTRRLREEPLPPQGWRTYQAPRRRGKGWYVAGLVAVVCLLAVVLAPSTVTRWFDDGQEGSSAPLAAESTRPDQAPADDVSTRLPTRQEPFRGSPAEQWGNGTAGIHLPVARATGWMSGQQVAQALEKTLDFLAASSLEPGVLRGERPHKAIALINPQQQDVQDYLEAAFTSPNRKNDPLLLFSRFRPSDVRPVGDVVKARGRLTYKEGKRGALEVTADVTYVYPVAGAKSGSDEVARTIVRRETVMSWDDPAKVLIAPGTFSLVSYLMDTTNGGCDTYTGYLTPEFAAERAVSGPGDGPETDPYDRSVSMDERMREAGGAGCGSASRT